jgi:hypothetical protein
MVANPVVATIDAGGVGGGGGGGVGSLPPLLEQPVVKIKAEMIGMSWKKDAFCIYLAIV